MPVSPQIVRNLRWRAGWSWFNLASAVRRNKAAIRKSRRKSRKAKVA